MQLARRELPRLTVERYRDVFRFPVEAYCRDIGLDQATEPTTDLSAEFHTEYVAGLAECPLREGVLDALAALRDAGGRQFVLSAMEEDMLRSAIDHLGIGVFFEAVYGLAHRKGDSKLRRGGELLAGFAIRPDSATVIGDTDHDAEVAQALGASVALIAGGHQSTARLRLTGYPVYASFADLRAALLP